MAEAWREDQGSYGVEEKCGYDIWICLFMNFLILPKIFTYFFAFD